MQKTRELVCRLSSRLQGRWPRRERGGGDVCGQTETEALPGLAGSLPAPPYGVLRVTVRELRPDGLMGMPVGFSAASPRGSEPQCVGALGSH